MVQLCRGLQTNTQLEEFGLGLRACTSQMKEVINATLAINLTLKRLLVMPEDGPNVCFAPRGADEYTDPEGTWFAPRRADDYAHPERYQGTGLVAFFDAPYQTIQAREAGLAVRTRD